MQKLTLSLLFILLSFYAKADQLAYITQAQAEAAVEMLKVKTELMLFCGCCEGDDKKYIRVMNVAYRHTGHENYYEVVVDGYDQNDLPISRPVDLAYVFTNDKGIASCVGKQLGFACDPCQNLFPWIEVPKKDEIVAAKPTNMEEVRALMGTPKNAKNKEVMGTIVLDILVDMHGYYVRHQIIRNPNSVLLSAVVKHINKLKFQPGTINGEPADVWARTSFVFDIHTANMYADRAPIAFEGTGPIATIKNCMLGKWERVDDDGRLQVDQYDARFVDHKGCHFPGRWDVYTIKGTYVFAITQSSGKRKILKFVEAPQEGDDTVKFDFGELSRVE
jgi:hypothetical protein